MCNLYKNYCNENYLPVQFVTNEKKTQVILNKRHKQYRYGFTLVELLVVVAIIGILATLITAAAFRVIATTRVTTVRMKINEIEMALEMYKSKFGEYPPMLADEKAVARHIKKRWPRCADTEIPNTNNKDSLVFWLGGFSNKDGKYCGFSVNKTTPFTVNDTNSDAFDNEVFIELSEDKNVREIENKKRIVISMGSKDGPVVYFRGKKGGGANAYKNDTNEIWKETFSSDSYGTASPYYYEKSEESDKPDKWHNSETFQLIHPGADGKFGKTAQADRITNGSKLDDGDYDNITNLGSSTIEALLP
ncbi:MAG: prepilin-type N-terminal cleavage/methylation domain-containing protein [Planctomycetaceae bacterium]|jgi:prepilin-type N-terminal cleavage/methylation domain-containing protein|nr:prepilin-type N-terminal cleavage/methylation domain-containing protein [Planctomycetaceae bacterium]